MNYDDFVRGGGQVLAKTGDGNFKMVSMPNEKMVDFTEKVLEEGGSLYGGPQEYKELIEGGGDLVNVKGMDWDEKSKLRNKAGELSGSDETGFMHQEKGQRFKKALNRYKKLFSKASKALPMLGILDIFNMKNEYDQIMEGEHPILNTRGVPTAAKGGVMRLQGGGPPGSGSAQHKDYVAGPSAYKTGSRSGTAAGDKGDDKSRANTARELDQLIIGGDVTRGGKSFLAGDMTAAARRQQLLDLAKRAKGKGIPFALDPEEFTGNLRGLSNEAKIGKLRGDMSPSDYHNYMRALHGANPAAMKKAFPWGSGAAIEKGIGALGNLMPGLGMAKKIFKSIQGSDLGTMMGDLIGNPLKNLYQNIQESDLGTMTGDIRSLITGNKAANPDAVSIVDNDWSKVSGDTYNKILKKDSKTIESIMQDNTLSSFEKQAAINDISGYNDATQYEWEKMGLGSGLDTESGFPEGLSGLLQENMDLSLNDILQGTGGFRGDETFNETIEDVPAAYAQFPNQGNTGFPWKMSESGHLLDPLTNPDFGLNADLGSLTQGSVGQEGWTPAKEQKLNALLAQLMQGYDNGVGSLTEPNINALKEQIMGNPVTPNFGDLSQLYGINANTFNPEAYIQEQMALGNPPTPNINTGLYNRGGIASLQYGGQPGPFTSATTVTEEEDFDIKPLELDPGIMGIGDLEDLFEEAKVKESIYDKLKYVNNTMHG